MEWENVVSKVSPYVVKIETPTGDGTGFLCFYNANKTFCGVATAYHVICDADKWQQPLRIHNHDFSKNRLIKDDARVIITDERTDSAVLLFHPGDFDFPEDLIPLRPKNKIISIGNDVGWLGYPGMYPWTLCFFSGSVSASTKNSYLIDGVAINGVSGGPVLYSSSADGVQFVGAISAYRANRQMGDTLPGLLIAQDVSHFHSVVEMFKSMDDAKKRKAAEEASKKQAESNPAQPEMRPAPSPVPPVLAAPPKDNPNSIVKA